MVRSLHLEQMIFKQKLCPRFAFSLSLSLTALMPFQCLPNPNGTSSMANNPGAICYQSADHWVLIAIGAVGVVLYPVSIVSWAAWTTYQYPIRAATGNGLTLLYRYRFFFQRFKQNCFSDTGWILLKLCRATGFVI